MTGWATIYLHRWSAEDTADAAAEDVAVAEGVAGVVSSSERVNVRMSPSTEAEIVAKLEPQAAVVIVGRSEDGSWLQVTLEGGTGWIAAELLAPAGDVSTLPVIEP